MAPHVPHETEDGPELPGTAPSPPATVPPGKVTWGFTASLDGFITAPGHDMS